MPVRRTRTALPVVLVATVALGGCGGSDGAPGTTAATSGASASATSTPQLTPTATPPSPAVAPAPPKPRTTPQQASNGAPADAAPATDAEYAARLIDLSKDLDTEIDKARTSMDSTGIGRVIDRIQKVVDGWTADGHAAGGGTGLLAAAQTARTNVESPLLLGEAHRQVAVARAALGG